MTLRTNEGGLATAEEKAAVANSGAPEAKGFDRNTDAQKDQAVFAVEELAAMYVAVGGDDPRAIAVIAAGQKAGRINKEGSYIGPTANSRGEMDDEGTPTGLTAHAARRKEESGTSDKEIEALIEELCEKE